jgi:hypothetical protein
MHLWTVRHIGYTEDKGTGKILCNINWRGIGGSKAGRLEDKKLNPPQAHMDRHRQLLFQETKKSNSTTFIELVLESLQQRAWPA